MIHYMEAESKKYELKFPLFNGRIRRLRNATDRINTAFFVTKLK